MMAGMTDLMMSCDDHIDLPYLPADLWVGRVPADLQDLVPAVTKDANGSTVWTYQGANWGRWAGGAWLGPPRSYQTALERAGYNDVGEMRPTTAALRLADMDRDGIDATVMYGPVAALDIADPVIRLAVYRAYNDWLREFCAYDPHRLIGVAMLPAEDPEGAAVELKRLADLGGVRQVSMHIARTAEPIYSDAWLPFWDLINESGIVASFHLVLTKAMMTGMDAKPYNIFATSAEFITQFLDPVVGMLGRGILADRPNAKLVLAEAGLGWLPWLLQDMDYRYQRLLSMGSYWETKGGIGLHEPPSETFKRQVWVTFQDDAVGLDVLKYFGDDKVMWACDYPHPDSTFPESQAVVDRLTGHLDPSLRRRLLHDNVAALYSLADSPR
jgi:uncharacterized protein